MARETNGPGDAGADRWLAGTASTTITPDRPTWMAGFASRDRPSEGVHMDLHAKALALEDYVGNRTVIVSVEILFVGRSLREEVERRCEEIHGLEPRRLLLNATHTHQGPVTRTATTDADDSEGGTRRRPKAADRVNFIPMESYDADEQFWDRTVEYQEWLADTLVELVGTALDDTSDAALYYSHGRCGSAMSRRRPTESGIGFDPYADGPVDHDVPVLVVEDPSKSGDDAIRALLFGYACHPTVQFLQEFSGDWIGYAQELLEKRYQNATAIFLQGCGGDQKAYPERELEYTEAHARALALGVEAALESVCQPVRGPLRVAYDEAAIAFEDPPSREELEATVDSDAGWKAEYLLSVLDERGAIPTEYPYPIQAIGFSTDLTLVALAGEVFAEYSLRLKDELDGNVWVAAYSNDAFTYVPTEQALSEGGYEADGVLDITTLPGKWKSDLEDRIVSKTHALVDRVHTPSPR